MARAILPDARPVASRPHAPSCTLVTSSSLIGTPKCVPWRRPFVTPVSCLLQGSHTRHLDFVLLKWHDLLGTPISGHCGNKIRATVRLALLLDLRI